MKTGTFSEEVISDNHSSPPPFADGRDPGSLAKLIVSCAWYLECCKM